MYLKVAPMFLVENVDEALKWHEDVFGAKLQVTLPTQLPFELASLLLGS